MKKEPPHKLNARDICIYCGRTSKEIEEEQAICRKPRFGEGAPGGFGAPNFVGPVTRPKGEKT